MAKKSADIELPNESGTTDLTRTDARTGKKLPVTDPMPEDDPADTRMKYARIGDMEYNRGVWTTRGPKRKLTAKERGRSSRR